MWLFLQTLVFSLAIAFHAKPGSGDNDFLVCKPLRSFFDEIRNKNVSYLRGPPGPPGKRGPKGYAGPPGPEGPTAPVDLDSIRRLIKQQLDARVGCAGVEYGRHCYRLLFKTSEYHGQQGKDDASRQCSNIGGELVDIENAHMYQLLNAYVEKAFLHYFDRPIVDYVAVWLASSYTTGVLRNASGNEVYAKWHPGHPSTRSSAVRLIVPSKPSRSPVYTGMQTTSPQDKESVPLCRYPLD